jgi:hypothetical protein
MQPAVRSGLSQSGYDVWHICRGKRGQDRPVYQGSRFLIGHADIAGPFEGKRTISRCLTERDAERFLKRQRDFFRTLHDRDRRFGKADPEAAPRFAVEEGVERYHVFNFDTVNAEQGRDDLDSPIADAAKAMLNLLDNIKKATSVSMEFPDDGLHRGIGVPVHPSILD